MKIHVLRFSACRIIAFGFFLPFLCSCSVVNGLVHYFKSTGHFKALPADERVFFEKGGEDFAKTVAALLPVAVKTVEQAQYGRFPKGIRVYVCATPESFEELTGRKVKGLAYRGRVFLSPRLLDNPEEVPAYLTHELSHLFMVQYRGLYGFMTTPPWFNEGLAVYVSKGGGAGSVTEKDAVSSMVSGKVFQPDTAGGLLDFLFPKYGSHWGLKPHMFYRQSSLFVMFLKENNEGSFKQLLVSLQGGEPFETAFQKAYGSTTREVWQLFIQQLKKQKTASVLQNRYSVTVPDPTEKPFGVSFEQSYAAA